MAEPTATPRPRALVVADSDSYLKWAVRRAEDLRDAYDVEVVVVRNAVTPSTAQRAAAIDGRLDTDPGEIGLRALAARLRAERPALLLLACRGPLIELLLLEELRGERAADVVVAGIPGIWFPPTALGLRLRAACDVMVVHSEREREAVTAMLADLPADARLAHLGLASLLEDQEVGGADRPRIVFAPQALVPARREDRVALLDALVDVARAHPELDVVIKLRGTAGEAQTHEEADGFEQLAAGREVPGNLVFAHGALREYLGDCAGFVTVSSTAALEAIAADVPVLVVDEFGVSAQMINLVFEGSGLFGGLDDLRALRFRAPATAWMDANYFQAEGDWVAVAQEAAGASAPGATMRDPHAGLMRSPQRLRRRSVALGAGDDSWHGPALAPLRAALAAYDRLQRRRRGSQGNRG
ncbi:DUF6716 putative glycosyltransferase [Demequina rhizosphaerae]|uniref:DUF6716 putative glycosyltransferase n=1 Tax=Demequina rhizosphaerae TaxID=1638985 RepID=UPI00078053C4|nr:DUF6716 putative glycosyltransferase [Demequina rhizosphaerae]